MIFFDIETISNINNKNTKSWDYKKNKQEYKKGIEFPDNNSAFYPAFNNIVCIVAIDKNKKEERRFSVRVDEENNYTEKDLINDFLNFCNYHRSPILCGHNIKNFDIPILVLRAANNNIIIPDYLKCAGKKPWEIKHVDTVEISQIGKGKYQSLDELCMILNVKTPKDNMDGSEVTLYWNEGKYDEVLNYCVKDVKSLVNCYIKMKKLNIL